MSTAATAATAPQQQGGFRRFWRTLRQIFHEVTAAVFAVLALAWLNAALRAWEPRHRALAHRRRHRRSIPVCVFRRKLSFASPENCSGPTRSGAFLLFVVSTFHVDAKIKSAPTERKSKSPPSPAFH